MQLEPQNAARVVHAVRGLLYQSLAMLLRADFNVELVSIFHYGLLSELD
jgi:hypothetical protein